jgi:hypothetical protein
MPPYTHRVDVPNFRLPPQVNLSMLVRNSSVYPPNDPDLKLPPLQTIALPPSSITSTTPFPQNGSGPATTAIAHPVSTNQISR